MNCKICSDRYFRLWIFDLEWTEIEYPGLGNSYITEEDLVWSRFLSSFWVKICPREVNFETLLILLCVKITIFFHLILSAFVNTVYDLLGCIFHLLWEKKVVYGQEMEFIDPCFKTFKFMFDVKPNATTILRGPIGKMFKYYNMKHEVYLHLNYVSQNVFLYMLFSLEGIEIDYSTNAASSSGTANIPADVVDQGSDHSLVKFLSGYDIGASSLVLEKFLSDHSLV